MITLDITQTFQDAELDVAAIFIDYQLANNGSGKGNGFNAPPFQLIPPNEFLGLDDLRYLKTSQNLYLLADWMTKEGWANSKNALAMALLWQNGYDSLIGNAVNSVWKESKLSEKISIARIVKRLIMNETQFIPDVVTGNEKATGLMQVSYAQLETLIRNGYLPPLPKGMSLEEFLLQPDNNILAGTANLKFIIDNVRQENTKNNWIMSDGDLIKLAVALHNTGTGDDFGSGYRKYIQNGSLVSNCTDPGKWSCISVIFPSSTQRYVENITGNFDAPPNQ